MHLRAYTYDFPTQLVAITTPIPRLHRHVQTRNVSKQYVHVLQIEAILNVGGRKTRTHIRVHVTNI